MAPMQKSFPTFDCDAHVTELPEIWNYLSVKEREFVKDWFWPQGHKVLVNGKYLAVANWGHGKSGNTHGFPPLDRKWITNVVEAAGPGVNKKIVRKLYATVLTEEQVEYTNHKGARDGLARLEDMDKMGIDQVVVVPLMMFSVFLFVENHHAAQLMARAYNDWVADWCSVAPDRLYPSAVLPIQNPEFAAEELRRVAEKGFKVAVIRPVDAQGNYPIKPEMEPVWRTFEETGLVVGMHSIVSAGVGESRQWGPGMFADKAVNRAQMLGASQTLSFPHEAIGWLTNVLLSGFLERYPGITRMAIMESGGTWVPPLLEWCDRAVKLYKNQRSYPVDRLPSEVFRERCFVSFEGDEHPIYRQLPLFEDIGIWASDAYHHDGSDVWRAMREMAKVGISEAAQHKLLGANAARMYGIEPKLFTEEEPASYPRPDWYPKLEDILEEYADRMTVS